MTLRHSRALRASVLMVVMAITVAVSAAFSAGSTARASNDAAVGVNPLAVNCPVSGHPTIREGASGVAVQRAQCLLNLSLNPASHTPLAVDGSFGPLTDRATRTFQGCEHIQVDGIIGPVTWSHLESVAASPFYSC